MTQDELDRVMALEVSVAQLMDSTANIAQSLGAIERSMAESGEAPEEEPSVRDDVWACRRCGARLGIYDRADDTLRIRYKDHSVYVKPGIGGSTMVPCRRCAFQNKLEDTRDAG